MRSGSARRNCHYSACNGQREGRCGSGHGICRKERRDAGERHRIGKYLPAVAHQGPDPTAVAVCREVLVESVILHGSRGWGGWDEQSDLNVIVIHRAGGGEVERDRLRGEVVRVKERRYRDSSDYKADLESGPDIVTPEDYAAQRRTLNHSIARAARNGTIFPKEPGAEGRYRHDGDTSN